MDGGNLLIHSTLFGMYVALYPRQIIKWFTSPRFHISVGFHSNFSRRLNRINVAQHLVKVPFMPSLILLLGFQEMKFEVAILQQTRTF